MNIISSITYYDYSNYENFYNEDGDLCIGTALFDILDDNNNIKEYSRLKLYIGTINKDDSIFINNSEIINKDNLDTIINLVSINSCDDNKVLNVIQKNIIYKFNKRFYLYLEKETKKKNNNNRYIINQNHINTLIHKINNKLYELGLTIELFSADRCLKYITLGETGIVPVIADGRTNSCSCYCELKTLTDILINKKKLYKLLEEKSSLENMNIDYFLKCKKLLDLI